jgi:hypothetical protein
MAARPIVDSWWKRHGKTASKMRADGYSINAIADALGTSFGTARKALAKHYDGSVGDPPSSVQVAVSPPRGTDVQVAQDGDGQVVTVRSQTVRTLEGLVEAAAIDLERWTVTDYQANKWDSASVDRQTGEIRVVELWQVKAKLAPNVERLIERVPPVPFAELEPAVAGLPGTADETWVLLPDTQHGFRWRDNYTRLEPMHDPVAIDAARQLCELLQPDGVGLLGDHLDATAWSRFRTAPGEHYTTQPALNALAWDLAELRRVCPRSRIVYTGGNHDERPEYRIAEQMSELAATRPVGAEVHPYSTRGLLRLDDLGIEHVPYKDGWWLWGDLEVTHEDGFDPVKALAKRAHSLVQGHTHRAVLAQRTLWGPEGRRLVYACSPGTLARLDAGAVPGTQPRQDWQQGVAVAQRVAGRVHLQLVPILDGRLVWGGSVIEGRDRSGEVAAFAGFPQIARGSPCSS